MGSSDVQSISEAMLIGGDNGVPSGLLTSAREAMRMGRTAPTCRVRCLHTKIPPSLEKPIMGWEGKCQPSLPFNFCKFKDQAQCLGDQKPKKPLAEASSL
jgi:hypothetical protein